MSTKTKDWIGDVEVFQHGGGGFAAAIRGANVFHPSLPGEHNKPLCQFRIAHGLPSRDAAEDAAREWVSRQAEALGLFRDRDARIAELEAQVRTAGAEALEKAVERFEPFLGDGFSFDDLLEEARRLRDGGVMPWYTTADARRDAERQKKEREDATDLCPHSWVFDGDDPRIKCVYCREVRDSLSGRVIVAGRPAQQVQGQGGE